MSPIKDPNHCQKLEGKSGGAILEPSSVKRSFSDLIKIFLELDYDYVKARKTPICLETKPAEI